MEEEDKMQKFNKSNVNELKVLYTMVLRMMRY